MSVKSPIFLLITFLFTHSELGSFHGVFGGGCRVMFYVTAALPASPRSCDLIATQSLPFLRFDDPSADRAALLAL